MDVRVLTDEDVKYRKFVAYFWFVGWDCLSLGFHICVTGPHIEIHVPFGFFRIGWVNCYHDVCSINAHAVSWREFGWS